MLGKTLQRALIFIAHGAGGIIVKDVSYRFAVGESFLSHVVDQLLS